MQKERQVTRRREFYKTYLASHSSNNPLSLASADAK